MPSLESAAPRPLPTTQPASVQPSPASPSVSPTVDDADTITELYELASIVGRRPTKFGKTKGGRWKHGGQTHDYEVLWSTGETTFEPESTLKQTHAPTKSKILTLSINSLQSQTFNPMLTYPMFLLPPRPLQISAILFTLVSFAIWSNFFLSTTPRGSRSSFQTTALKCSVQRRKKNGSKLKEKNWIK